MVNTGRLLEGFANGIVAVRVIAMDIACYDYRGPS